jgi:uncharacterized protein YneF (UPF0154 family)
MTTGTIILIAAIYLIIIGIVGYGFIKRKRNKKNNELKPKPAIDYEAVARLLKPGDFIVSWGKGFIGRLVSFLIFLKDGIKDAASHNMHVHDENSIASAESLGYRIIDTEKRLRETRRIRAYRFKSMTPDQLKNLKKYAVQFTSKSYDYAIYFIHILRVMMLFIPLYIYFRFGNWQVMGLGIVILAIIYVPLMRLLKMWEKAAVHCAEAETILYGKIGLLKKFSRAAISTPHENLNILENMAQAQCIYDSDNPFVDEN